MGKRIHVACSPLSNTIYAGSLSRDGKLWLSDKTDVTNEALAAVAEHIGAGHVLTLSADGRPMLEIEVRAIAAAPEAPSSGEVRDV